MWSVKLEASCWIQVMVIKGQNAGISCDCFTLVAFAVETSLQHIPTKKKGPRERSSIPSNKSSRAHNIPTYSPILILLHFFLCNELNLRFSFLLIFQLSRYL